MESSGWRTCAVKLNADDENRVEPDSSVICGRNKLSDRGCEGAPDFIIEVVSLGSRPRDYQTKMVMYANAGVREYWIVDPMKKATTVYYFGEDVTPIVFLSGQNINVGIYGELHVNVEVLLK